jgi:hypothetical protein
MKRRFGIAAALFTAALTLTPAAQASDSLVGALLGAGAGVLVGQAVGGRDGAIVGGGIGALAGAAIASERHRPREVYAPAPRRAYYAEPTVVEHRPVRYVERGRDWDNRGWHERHREVRPWRDSPGHRAGHCLHDD